MERGYTVKDAAKRLGVSEKTLRKRIKEGNIRADLMDGPRGPQYTVWLTVEEGEGSAWNTGSLEPPVETLPAPIDSRLAPLLALPDQVTSMESRMEDRLAEVGKSVADSVQAVLSLEQKVQESTQEIARLRDELERARRPWWKRWGR